MELTPEYQKKIRDFIEKWDSEHPVDFWYRRKFRIPFGSPEHLATSFIDQQIWHEEQEMVKRIQERPDLAEQGVIDSSSEGIQLTQEEVEDAFDDLDIGD